MINSNRKLRYTKDVLRNTFSYIFSSFGVLILLFILIFIFSRGKSILSLNFITSDYNIKTDTLTLNYEAKENTFKNPNIDGVYFASNYGVGFSDSYDNNKEPIVIVSYIDNASPFNNMKKSSDSSYVEVKIGQSIDNCLLINGKEIILASAKDKAQNMALSFEKSTSISSLTISTLGGGIRGSLISTLLVVVLTLLFALPLGIASAVFLSFFAKNERIKNILTSLIDLAGGIPSIIYGLAGAIIFIPFLNKIGLTDGGSLISGSLTLSLLLLPTIIKTTIEAIKSVPESYVSASLALGANESQTIFKIMLPNALPGILTALLLSIGRIVGESAALIYAIGSAIKDKIVLTESSATLATHIWSLCAGENPNYNASCAVSIIILSIVLILNLIVKLISIKFVKKFKR